MSSIGKIIKGLAVGLTILGLLGSLILYFVGNSAYEEDKDYLEYATINGGGYGYCILEEHLQTCVAEAVRQGDDDILQEALALIKKLK